MTTAPAPARKLDPALLKLAGVVVLGALMSSLDTTVVNVGVDTLGTDLHAPLPLVQWVSTSYLLALSLVIPLSGWAVDRLGAKKVWLLSLSVFVIGSALCGLANSIGELIAFRALQGLGGGLLMPVLQTILARAAGPALVGRLMSLVTLPVMLSPVFGPVLAGFLIDTLGWQWIFYVNLPIGVVALALAWFKLPAGEPVPGERLDWLGMLLLSPGLAASVYGLILIGEGGDTAGGAGWLVAGLALVGAFCWHALRGREAKPLLDLRLFATKGFSVSWLGAFLLGAGLFGFLFVLPLYYQVGLGKNALEAGLFLLPQGVGVALVSPFTGRLTDRFGVRAVVTLGVLAMVVGTAPFVLLDSHPDSVQLVVALVLRGLGLGASLMPTTAAAYQFVAKQTVPRAATLMAISQRIGGSLATAVLAVVLHRWLDATGNNMAFSFGQTFLWALAIGLLALVPALMLPARTRP
ncbi:DHA2 family efflux MFS transporter permease subunit [Kutzneria viridogrisea]|uniref:EmrB/QacA subfamily drug resistance transporter n=1 Tax=Kutzneria viridogrisea TaxID=47990 RepID=A0ABR6BHV1_9PSEU|nr:EmrB/QacA subfamily drug resistance transporter [Kutzneria viridogrisea]